MCEGEKDGAFVIVIWAQSYCGSKVTSLSILPFSLSMLYWEVSLLIPDNVWETWWEMDNIKASIGHWWQGWTAIPCGINSWICSQVMQSISPNTQLSSSMLVSSIYVQNYIINVHTLLVTCPSMSVLTTDCIKNTGHSNHESSIDLWTSFGHFRHCHLWFSKPEVMS